MEPVKITRKQFAADPHAAWNAFVELLANADSEELTTVQLAAFLAFWYESEVQNGGHYQYFQNRGTEEIAAVVLALRALSAHSLAEVAKKAKARVESHAPAKARTADEFVVGALEGKFDDLDAAFHECKPTIMDALESYLAAHEPDFVERVP